MEQYKRILLKEFDSKQKVITELINLEAILNLPKGTELYLSDIHGEFEAFDYILRTCAGNLNEKINDCFGEGLVKAEKDKLTLLIAYPQEVLNDDFLYPLKDKNWYGRIIQNLFTLLAFVAAKYTRSKVRKALPTQYTYIMEELLYTDRNLPDNNIYFETIQNYLIDLGEANAFILALSKVIRQLIIDHLHIVGDIFDRGAAADKVMNELMAYHSVDIQWGNHDIIWMGAFFGSKECLLTLLRIAARYGYLYDIERAYGLNLRPLVLFAEKAYSENAKFKPNLGKRSDSYAPKEILQLEKIHQALAIIQFKLESQLIQRRPEFDMAQNVTLDKIDYWEESILVGGKKHFLANTCFQTINPQKPEELTDEEEEVVATLLDSFQHSLQLKSHISFLMKKGSMYKIYNNHLLFHGCIPLGESGDFEPLQINEIRYTGKELLDFFDDFSTDLIWYCWNGKLSPLFGKDKMTTLERYFIEDKETHIEKENPYFSYRNSAKICKLILEEFGLVSENSRIVNGHTPVKTLKGESPIRGEGMLFVIDGGLCEAYQKKTGIAGYSLLNNSYGFQIVTHQPFQNVQKMIEEALDLSSLKRVIEHVLERTLIKSTTIGQSLIEQQQELSVLLHEFYDY